MEPRLIQFSAVVVGQTHNPTILNPDFLASEGIVPKSWHWAVADTMTTLPFAVVRYSNGVSITVELNKLQVTDPDVENGPENSRVSEIASAYVRTLPHVHYTAVGNNFQSVIQVESPGAYLKDRFLKAGPWDDSSRTLEALGVRLVYPLDHGRLTLSIDVGEAKLPDSEDKQAVVIANANFSRECAKDAGHEQVSKLLKIASSDCVSYGTLLSNIINKVS